MVTRVNYKKGDLTLIQQLMWVATMALQINFVITSTCWQIIRIHSMTDWQIIEKQKKQDNQKCLKVILEMVN